MNQIPKYKIAVIDDEIDLGTICVEILQIHGFEAVHFSEAESFLQERNLPIDLLITDISLGGKSGYDLAAEYHSLLKKERKSAVPTLFISGAGERSVGIANLDPGNTFFLEKPFNLDKLLSTVHSIFSIKSDQKSTAA